MASIILFGYQAIHLSIKIPKWKASYDDGRKYNSEWEKSLSNENSAFCKLCNFVIKPKLYILKKNENTSVHQAKAAKAQSSLLKTFTVTPSKSKVHDDPVKTAELE